jgi:hypothetical protein
VIDGEWRAEGRDRLFVGSTFGGDQSCLDSSPGLKRVDWVVRAASFGASGENRVLMDADGAKVAVLRPGAQPTTGPNRAGSYAEYPAITARMRAAALEPAPLPPGAEPVTAQRLTGRWVPVNKPDSKAYVVFEDTGSWRGVDGCNGVGGRFSVGRGGRLLATTGPTTLVGCENSRLPDWVASAGRAGFTQGRLVLYDASGTKLGEAARA